MSDPKYKYQEIKDYIISNIYQGIYKDNDILPTEKQLAEQFNTTRLTANKALSMVAETKMIERIQGSGSYVRLNREDKTIRMTSYSHDQSRIGNWMTSQVVCYSRIKAKDSPVKGLPSLLMISISENVHYIRRVRFINNEPVVVQDMYIPENRIPISDLKVMEHSFFNYVEKVLHLKIDNGSTQVRIVLPDKEIQNYLKITDEEPVALIEHLSYLNNRLPFELSRSYQNYRQFGISYVNKYL